jgi:hypothetical protein
MVRMERRRDVCKCVKGMNVCECGGGRGRRRRRVSDVLSKWVEVRALEAVRRRMAQRLIDFVSDE